MRRVLHVLSQRPELTGSGVTLDALVREASSAGWEQHAMVGVPHDDRSWSVGGLSRSRVDTVTFDGGDLDFPVPGMSDVMPYVSTRFSEMTSAMIERYTTVWNRRLTRVVERFRPDVIHTNHVWLVSSRVKDVAPDVPLVVHGHATGLRQMELCPHLATTVQAGCSRAEAFVTLHEEHARAIVRTLGVSEERVHVVGAGYRDDVFHARGRASTDVRRLAYVGKYSRAKGVTELLEAFSRVAADRPSVELHMVGSGTGPEAAEISSRTRAMSPRVVQHGTMPQRQVADLLRTCHTAVLPSYYEGLPLVLVEALACGCRLVATALEGVRQSLAPHLGDALTLVEPPRVVDVDAPHPDDLPAFVGRLSSALDHALGQPELGDPDVAVPGALERFTWRRVFGRIQRVWRAIST